MQSLTVLTPQRPFDPADADLWPDFPHNVALRNTHVLTREKVWHLVKAVGKCQDLAQAATLFRRAARLMPDTVTYQKCHWRKTPAGPKVRVWTTEKVTDCTWKRCFRDLGDYFHGLHNGHQPVEPPFSLFILKGNTKLPFCTWSTLPVVTCPGMGECGRYCYSLKTWARAEALCRQVLSTLLLRFRPEVVDDAWADIPPGLTVRLYVDGDFESSQVFADWVQRLRRRPDLNCYGYSKSWDVIYQHGVENGFDSYPPNYVLNLSTGGRAQKATAEQMLALPCTRGWFASVKVPYRPEGHKGNYGFARYADPKYHAATKAAARKAGHRGSISCPGHCGSCHWCGDMAMKNVTIVNGVH